MAERILSADEVTRLYEQHGAVLLAYACSFLPDAASAEDAVQKVFLKLLHGETAAPDVPLAYLYRSVRNTALNTRRKDRRDVPIGGHDSWFEHRGRNLEAALSLQTALAALPEEQREVVMMRIWSGMKLEEVADATGVPLNTVASRYRYALDKLRERLRPYRANEEKRV